MYTKCMQLCIHIIRVYDYNIITLTLNYIQEIIMAIFL